MINDTLQLLNKMKLLAAATLALGATTFAPVSMAEEGATPAGDLVVNEASSLDELLENVQARRVVNLEKIRLASSVSLTRRRNKRVCCKRPRRNAVGSSDDQTG